MEFLVRPEVVVLLKWLAQLLLLATGVWALLGVESLVTDAATGKRRLTTNGWTKVALLIVGFALFAATDAQQKKEARRRELQAGKELEDKDKQLLYLKQVILTQNQLAGVRLEWTLGGEVHRRMRARLDAAAAERGAGDAAVLAAAFEDGALEVRRISGERWAVHVDVQREGTRFARRYEQPSAEWKAFEEALLDTFGECRVELSGGELLAEPLGRHWPCRATVARGATASFVIDRPGLTLSALDEAALVVVAGPGVTHMPPALRVVSLDRKVALDEALALQWKSEEYESYVDSGGAHASQRMRSVSQPLYATIVSSPAAR